MTIAEGTFRRKLFLRRGTALGFSIICVAATLLAIAVLGVLLVQVASKGLDRVNWDFINSFPSRNAEDAGIKAALWGTLWLMAITAILMLIWFRRRGWIGHRDRPAGHRRV